MPKAKKQVPTSRATGPYAHKNVHTPQPYSGSDDEKSKTPVTPGGYDKALLTRMVVESAKLNSSDWEAVAEAVGQTTTKTKDIWRKVIKMPLILGNEWSKTTSSAWTSQQKIVVVNEVLDRARVDWNQVAASFSGKTATQVKDVWRKVILPRLRRGDPAE